MIGKIKGILGHIGASYVDAQGQLHKGTVLLDVIEQVESLPAETTIIEIPVNSPGGYADIGDAIYEYLVSLKKKGKQIVTIQTGLVGSIATKIFLAGDRRIVDDRYQFWIHNPYLDKVTGDQDQLRAMAADLEKTEKDLRKFYGEFTSITDEGLDGLMKIETGLTADQCVKFKFATEKKLVPVFNLINPTKKTMKLEEKSLKDQLLELLGVKPESKGVKPKAAIPANTEVKSLVVNLADGAGSFYVEGEALAEGMPCYLLDADGNPTEEAVQDGDYKLEDGSMVSVAGGKVAKVTPMAEESKVATQEEIDAKVKEAVDAAKAEMKKEFETLTLALKKETKLGVAPKPAVLAKVKGGDQGEYKTISQIQAEREAERRKSKFNTK